jgi:DNA-binding GntR family transcriptional regulator
VAENRLQHSHVEHEALVAALLAHDGEAAAAAMHSHAANSAMNVLQHFGNDARSSAPRAAA